MFANIFICLLLVATQCYGAVQDKKLNQYAFLMTHNSATGELSHPAYSDCQGVTMVNQLNCGTRAFDYRPYLNGDNLIAHHGDVLVDKPMSDSVQSVLDWLSIVENQKELVILYVSHCDEGSSSNTVNCYTAARNVLATKSVYTIDTCTDLVDLTVASAFSLR
jgi:hypothetical protein